jgi:hypothetical protein
MADELLEEYVRQLIEAHARAREIRPASAGSRPRVGLKEERRYVLEDSRCVLIPADHCCGRSGDQVSKLHMPAQMRRCGEEVDRNVLAECDVGRPLLDPLDRVREEPIFIAHISARAIRDDCSELIGR